MQESNLTYDKSYKFALRIVSAYKYLSNEEKEWVLSKQLLRCGTSIGANVAEANGAISKADFSNKISIAYKESLETKYWLSLLRDSEYISSAVYKSMFNDADELSKILFSTLKKTRLRKTKKNANLVNDQ